MKLFNSLQYLEQVYSIKKIEYASIYNVRRRRWIFLLLFLLFGAQMHAQQSDSQWKIISSDTDALPRSTSTILVVVSNVDSLAATLNEFGCRDALLQVYSPSKVVALSPDAIPCIRQMLVFPWVQSVAIRKEHPQEERSLSDADLSFNAISAAHAIFPDWNGGDLMAAIKEDRYDTTDIDLRGRHLANPRASLFGSVHATTMVTIIAGAGNSFYNGKGAARAARVTSTDFGQLLPEPDSYYDSLGISVQNHSYGVGIENFYGPDAMAYDQSVAIRPGLIHVFSAGNRGDQIPPDGIYAGLPGFANLSGSFKMAKNVLIVGALDSLGNLAPLSSRGPAYDGRLKPDLVALGQEGTSGAAAVVSGIALLLQHSLSAQLGYLPPASLVRAILINTADDYGTPGPDFESGYGNANAYRALKTVATQRYFQGTILEDDTTAFALHLPDSVVDLHITLTWTDPPAVSGATQALTNDLDLVLQHSVTNELWQPLILNSKAVLDSLVLPARPGRDSINNVEQIQILHPLAGDYLIKVTGHRLEVEPQHFSIAVWWDTLHHFEWTFPHAEDPCPAGKTVALRWETTAVQTDARLEYKWVGESQWNLLSDTLKLSQKSFRWRAPQQSGPAQVRLLFGAEAFVSDTFVMSAIPVGKIGFRCADSLLVYWNSIDHAQGYQLYDLGDRNLQAFKVVTDTFQVLHEDEIHGNLLAVAPLFEDNRAGIKSQVFSYTNINLDCYLRSFLADYLPDSAAVALRLEIGSVYRVKKLVFEKLIAGNFQTIETFPAPEKLIHSYKDRNLQQGLNSYRAYIELLDGTVFFTEVIDIYHTLPGHYLVFPNPVEKGGNLSLLSNGEEETFQLFDALGRKALEQKVEDYPTLIDLRPLPAGIYFYFIISDGRRKNAGQIVIRP